MARRGRKTRPSKTTHNSTSGWGILLVGILLGAIPVAFLYRSSGWHDQFISRDADQLLQDSLNASKDSSENIPRTEFDFFDLLPKDSGEKRSTEQKPAVKESPLPEISPQEGNRYLLQAASYTRYADADKLRARLALQGMKSYIKKVDLPNKGLFYRVYVGPYDDLASLARDNQELASFGIDALTIKLDKP